MKKTILFLTIVILSFSGCAVFNQLNNIKNLEYNFAGFSIGLPSFTGIKLNASVDIYNPNKADVTIKSVHYKVLVNGNQIATGKSDKEMKIKKRTTSRYQTDVNILFSNINESLMDVVKSREGEVELEGEVTFKTSFGKYVFPFRLKKSLADM